MDKVVNEIDSLAQQKNTNRSNLINQILAEYVSLVTPEKKINNIFTCINDLLNSNIFSSNVVPYESIMNVKSILNYKYRPTVKYAVELFRNPKETLGNLKIVFRTQSSELLCLLENFFKKWATMESGILYKYYGITIEYAFDNGKFTRSFALPEAKNFNNEKIAEGISSYIGMLDEIIKNYLIKKYQSFAEIEDIYLNYISNKNSIIF
jgi:hypothetical protein